MMPRPDQPLSERYRVVAKDWVAKKAAADLLENSKGAFFSQLFLAQEGDTIAEREHLVKVSERWNEYLVEINDTRTAANMAQVKMKYVEMQYYEHQSGARRSTFQ